MVVCVGRGGGSIEAGVMTNLHYNGVNGISDNIKVAFLCSRFDCKQNQEVPEISRGSFFFKLEPIPEGRTFKLKKLTLPV